MTAETKPDIVVLRKGTHGMSTDSYVSALRKRLPELNVVYANSPRKEREYIEHAPIATGVEIDEELLEHARNLRLFACAFAGVDHLPMDALEDANVAVTNASGIHAPSIADQALGYLLFYARRLDEGLRRTQNSEWRHYKAYELTGSTVTVVGLGAIGTAIVKRLQGFDTHTIGVRYTPEKGGPTDEVLGFDDDIHDALARTDYLVGASPLTDTTRDLIGEEEFVTLSPESVLVNVARGPIVDTGALTTALQSEQIRAAALDVTDPEPLPTDHPLWNLENVLITAHNAGHTPKHWERLADILKRNVKHGYRTGEYTGLENQILAPDG